MSEANAIQCITLYNQTNGRDAVYKLAIEPHGDGYKVIYQNGRRGSTLTRGEKTPNPVTLEVATKEFNKVMKSKMSSGYVEGTDDGNTIVAAEDDGTKSTVVMMLSNAIDEEEAQRLIHDDNWLMQEKHDGERRGIEKTDSSVHGINRKGLYVGLSSSIANSAKAILASCIIDSEDLGVAAVAFDMLELGGVDIRTRPYIERLQSLERLIGDMETISAIRCVKTAYTTEEKLKLYAEVKARKGEGVVFKHRYSEYEGGRPNSGGMHLKRKFVERCTAIVSGIHSTKRSVSVKLLDEEGIAFDVGNVTIPPNYDMPDCDQTVEIEYLYAYFGGSLYQPVYRGVRTDIETSACTMKQLKYKPEAVIA